MPGPDRVVVQVQHLHDRLAAHAVVQQNQSVGPTGQAVRDRVIPHQLNQVLSRFAAREAETDYSASRIPPSWFDNRFVRLPAESGYIEVARTLGALTILKRGLALAIAAQYPHLPRVNAETEVLVKG